MTTQKITMADVVDRLFTRLSATYGAAWTRQWADVPITDVKTAWSYELAGYFGHLQAIAYALDNLPDRCPNVIQFRNLCRAAPSPDVPRLDPPKADPVRVAEAIAKMAPATDNPHGMKAWAHRMKSRHDGGDKLSQYQIKSYQIALGVA